jgi:hypothetical protein
MTFPTRQEIDAKFDEIKAAADRAVILRRQGFDETDPEGLGEAYDMLGLWAQDPRLLSIDPGLAEQTVAEYGSLPIVLVDAFAQAARRVKADPDGLDAGTELWLRFFAWLASELVEANEAADVVEEAERTLDDD